MYKGEQFSNFRVGQTDDVQAALKKEWMSVIRMNIITDKAFDCFDLVWNKECSTRNKALELEKHINQLTDSQKQDLIDGRMTI